MTARAARTLVYALALVWGSGCATTSRGLRLPEGFETVGVVLFDNDSHEPDLERELHAALSVAVRDLVKIGRAHV